MREVIVCYTRCWPCQFDEHPSPPQPHTWMDQDDAEHAGHPWPLPADIAAKHPCACSCGRKDATTAQVAATERTDTLAARLQQAEAEIERLTQRAEQASRLYAGAAETAAEMAQRAEQAEDLTAQQASSVTQSRARADDAEATRDRWRKRAEKAEAAIAEVRRLQDMTIAVSCRVHAIDQAQDTLAVLARAALDEPGPAVTGDDVRDATAQPRHTGGNAEECPACDGSNPPYPFICPGPGLVQDTTEGGTDGKTI